MAQPNFIDDLSAKLSQLLAQSPLKDFEKNARAMMTSTFSKLDLVTREEFDIQSQVLLATREKLEALERRVAALEAQRERA
jgi:ubiquinone biosynthesis accessory factor UbiK